jgi:hypothetical protein
MSAVILPFPPSTRRRMTRPRRLTTIAKDATAAALLLELAAELRFASTSDSNVRTRTRIAARVRVAADSAVAVSTPKWKVRDGQ